MNGTQTIITIGYTAVVVLCCVGLAVLLRSVKASNQADTDHEKLARMETRWGYVVGILLTGFLLVTIVQVPYGQTSTDDTGAQHVEIVGQQFGWSVRPHEVKAGQPVLFVLTSKDVQHGFGVYRGHELVFQVQVPAEGSEQRYVHTFDEPGTYEILCLEFCGYQHHAMRGTLRVQ